MTGASPAAAPAQRFPAEPLSVRQGRRFVRQCLAGLDGDLLDTVELLASEIMTNCLLHADSAFEVRVWGDVRRVHVRVSDSTPQRLPVARPHSVEDTSGRGLQLVAELASYYGVDQESDHKTVWFEVWAPDLPRFAEPHWPLPPAAETDSAVELGGVPVGLYRAAHRHRDALLREAKLHTLTHGDVFGVSIETLLRAEAAHAAISASVHGQIEEAAEQEATLRLRLPPACAEAVQDLQHVLAVANDAARSARFLTRPALPEVASFRHWLLEEIIAQLRRSRPARPWQSPEPELEPPRLLPSGPGDPWGIATSPTPTVVADDDNIIVAVNQPLADLLGWPLAALPGRRLVSIIPPAWRQRHVVGFTNFLLTGTPTFLGREVRLPALAADGGQRPVRLLVRVRQQRDGRTAFVAELRPA